MIQRDTVTVYRCCAAHVEFTEAGGLEFLAYILPEWKQNRNYLFQGITTVVSGNCGYDRTITKAWFDQLRMLN